MNICLVCLRVDKRTKVNTALSEFHRGLCAFKLCGVSEIYYCTECEYLMMKFYKFKQKCVKASEIFQLWNKYDRKERKSINTLYKFMPQPSIDVWRPHPKRIGCVFINNTETEEDSDIEVIEERNINKEKINTTKNIETNPDPKQNGNPDYKQNSKPDRKQNDNIATKSAENKGHKDITRKSIEIVSDTITDDIEIVDRESEEDIPNNTTEKEKSVENIHQDITRKDIGIANSNPNDLVITVYSEKGIKATEMDKLNCNNTLQQLLSNAYIDKGTKKQVRNNEGILFDDDGETDNLKNNVINKIINEQEMDVMKYKQEDVLKKMKDMTKCKIKKDKRLAIEELTSQLSVFGELATPTGLVIEKGLLLMLATHEAGDVVLDKLKNTTCREDVLILSQEIEFALDTINSELVKKEDEYRTVFDIELLNTREQKMAEFERRKSYECYVNTKYKCETCYRPFKSAAQLEYHMRKVHVETSGSVCCPICKIWQSRRSHNLTHSVVFKCKLCPLVTYHRNSMQKHCRWHQGKQYHCEQCNATFKSNSAYRTHLGKVHRRGRNVCQACGRGFYSPLGLSIHKNTSSRCNVREALPKETESVRCEDCDVTLPSKEVFEAHLVDVHDAPKVGRGRPMAVDSSGLPEYRISNRKKRTRKARVPAQHTCRVCNEVGVSFGWLQLHFRKLHPNEDMDALYADKKTQLCDICGTGFSQIYALRDHMNIHTGARPHACDLCPKRFRSAILRNEHRLRHFPSTKACNYCGKGFKTLANLNNHVRIHVGEKNYKCDICSKAFLHRTSLREHVRGVHYNIRRTKRAKVAPSDEKHTENSD